MRQHVLSVSGDSLAFYISIISWLRFQREITWVNVNFQRRDLTSAWKSFPFQEIFENIICIFSLIKQNVTPFFSIFHKKTLYCANQLKLLLPGPVSFPTSYQRCLVRQRLLISAPSSSLLLPLYDMQPQQTALFKIR